MPGLFRRTRRLLRHPEELASILGEALKKAYAKRSVLFRIFSDFLLLFRLVSAWALGDYRQVPTRAIFWAVVAILYFLNPLDLIPDIFPGGYLDDIAFISFVLKRIQVDLNRFSEWEKTRTKKDV